MEMTSGEYLGRVTLAGMSPGVPAEMLRAAMAMGTAPEKQGVEVELAAKWAPKPGEEAQQAQRLAKMVEEVPGRWMLQIADKKHVQELQKEPAASALAGVVGSFGRVLLPLGLGRPTVEELCKKCPQVEWVTTVTRPGNIWRDYTPPGNHSLLVASPDNWAQKGHTPPWKRPGNKWHVGFAWDFSPNNLTGKLGTLRDWLLLPPGYGVTVGRGLKDKNGHLSLLDVKTLITQASQAAQGTGLEALVKQ